jgi:general nucleoside transport system ATP-binding protein
VNRPPIVQRGLQVPDRRHGVEGPRDTGEVAVELSDISKRFGDVQALDAASFSARAGEIHALLGENGAGKTTIMNVLVGLYRADSGEVRLGGAPVTIRSPRDAADHRVGMVHQHFELVKVFDGLDNILLGAESTRFRSDRARHEAAIDELAGSTGLTVDLQTPVGELAVGDQQKIEILRTLYAGIDVLILDEPSTHLTPAEVDTLFSVIRRLADEGLTVVLITHKLNEVLAIADRITVLRRGATVGTIARQDASRAAIVEMMMGKGAAGDRSTVTPRPREPEPDTAPLLMLNGVRADAGPPIDLRIERGELVGVAGVAGNGQQRLVRLISGLDRAIAGTIQLGGNDITSRSVAERIRAGIAVLPDDRMRDGVLASAPLHETYYLGVHQLTTGSRVRRSRLRTLAREAIQTYRVVARDEDVVTATLSGGNVQKLLVARAEVIATAAEDGVVIAMNASRGLDVGAAAFVHERFLALRDSGRSVIFLSEDLDELMHLCDRIVVVHAGSIVASFDRGEYDRYEIGGHMVGSDD